ncbi:uncharacterized protein LOC135960904 [Calliphora vicina]|uniref:uncharacterized protein LOC135960904 n=1 Tax=Calliphora vicina TaxID=7373 RepID=UPI00325B3503
MKCWSRSTLGVIIGILNILLYICVAVIMIAMLQTLQTHFDDMERSNTTPEQKEKLDELGTVLMSTVLAACLVMVVISGVLIMGIVQRRHKLMVPWLVLSGIGFVCDCGRVILIVILGFVKGHAFSTVLVSFVSGVLGVGIEALILWPIYTLWRDIRRKNEEKPGQIIGGVQYETAPAYDPPQYDYYTSIPQKS